MAKDGVQKGARETSHRRVIVYLCLEIWVECPLRITCNKFLKLSDGDGEWQCHKCVTRVVLLALAVSRMCHAGGVAGSGSATNVLRGWCCWLWQCHKCVTRVVLLALAVSQMCQAGA